ncbi:MAG: conjugal transfer protein TraF [Rubrivivax sp.]
MLTGRRLALLLAALAAGTATLTPALAQQEEPSYFKRSREGWFWQDPERFQSPPPVPAQAASAAVAPAPKPLTSQERDLAAFEAFKRRFEQSLNAATENPSEENVALFLELYAQARAKASVFADTAQAVAVRMPWIDETFSGSRPSLPTAMAAYDSITMQDRDQLLREMSLSWGLYFFYRRNCAYCHLMAPQLRLFQDKYGFTVFPVTMDGGVLPDFPNSARDAGLSDMVAEALKIPPQHFVVPALVLARPATREVVPIGFGALNMTQMVERIALAARVRDHAAGQASLTAIDALVGQRPAQSAIERARKPLAAPAAGSGG